MIAIACGPNAESHRMTSAPLRQSNIHYSTTLLGSKPTTMSIKALQSFDMIAPLTGKRSAETDLAPPKAKRHASADSAYAIDAIIASAGKEDAFKAILEDPSLLSKKTNGVSLLCELADLWTEHYGDDEEHFTNPLPTALFTRLVEIADEEAFDECTTNGDSPVGIVAELLPITRGDRSLANLFDAIISKSKNISPKTRDYLKRNTWIALWDIHFTDPNTDAGEENSISDRWMHAVFNKDSTPPAEFDALVERAIHPDDGLRQLAFSRKFYHHARSLSKSYRDRDAVCWDDIPDKDCGMRPSLYEDYLARQADRNQQPSSEACNVISLL